MRLVYIYEAVGLHLRPFFVCVWEILCLLAFWASVGFILRPRLNGVLMALEGGGYGKVRVPFPGGEIGEK